MKPDDAPGERGEEAILACPIEFILSLLLGFTLSDVPDLGETLQFRIEAFEVTGSCM